MLINFTENNMYTYNMDNRINTRKKDVRYYFVTPSIVKENKPALINYYYQVCNFPYKEKYAMRRYAIDPEYNILEIKQYLLTKKQLKKFYRTHLEHKYKRYNTYTLKNIFPPTISIKCTRF